MIELTEDERKNGWTPEALAAYLAERERAQADAADAFNREKPKPVAGSGGFKPFRWRR